MGVPRGQQQHSERAAPSDLRPRRRADERHQPRHSMRQPSEDRALYYRQLRTTIQQTFVPELTSAQSTDAAGVDGCSVAPEELTAYLRRRLPDSADVVVEHMSVVPGGRSKETILVSLSGTTELPHDVILRKDRPVSVLQTRAVDEYAVIKAIYDYGGVPVPQPFFAAAEGHGLGDGTLLIMERVRGRKAGEFFPDLAGPAQHREELGLQLAAGLARLHSMPLDRLRQTSLDTKGAAVTEEGIVAAVEGMVTRINELTGPPCATVPLARRWLLDHVADVVPGPRPCLLWGDFGFPNMLVDDGRITALVDWEATAVGPPPPGLAAAWNAVATPLPRPAVATAYIDPGGPVGAPRPAPLPLHPG